MTANHGDRAMGDQSETDKLGFDPAEVARLYAGIAARSSDLLTRYVARQTNGGFLAPMSDELGISKAFFEAWARMLTDPMRVAEAGVKLWQDYWSLWQRSTLKLMGQVSAPVAE